MPGAKHVQDSQSSVRYTTITYPSLRYTKAPNRRGGGAWVWHQAAKSSIPPLFYGNKQCVQRKKWMDGCNRGNGLTRKKCIPLYHLFLLQGQLCAKPNTRDTLSIFAGLYAQRMQLLNVHLIVLSGPESAEQRSGKSH